jgi:hypothetical protein
VLSVRRQLKEERRKTDSITRRERKEDRPARDAARRIIQSSHPTILNSIHSHSLLPTNNSPTHSPPTTLSTDIITSPPPTPSNSVLSPDSQNSRHHRLSKPVRSPVKHPAYATESTPTNKQPHRPIKIVIKLFTPHREVTVVRV